MSEIIAFIIKTCLVCIFTFLLTRIMSKKAMSQLSAFELAGIVIFSNIASQPIGTTSLTTTILAMFIITFLIMITGKLVLINKFSMILEDVPTVLVEGGKIDFKQLKKEYMSLNQFLALLREKGYDSVSEIDYVILEPSGQLSIFPIGEQKPITKKDLNLDCETNGITLPVIMDGIIIEENLQRTKYSKKDILNHLKNKNIEDISDIVVGEVQPNGEIFLLRKEYIS